jgi:PAS domain S-box-containing protein
MPLEALHCLFETTDENVMYALDEAYRYTFFSQTHFKAIKIRWGHTIKIGESALQCLPSSDQHAAKVNFDRVIKGERFITLDRLANELGQHSVQESCFSPLLDANRKIVGLVVSETEAISRVQQKEDLIIAQERLRLALSGSKTGVWDWQITTGELHWSDEVYEIFDVAKDDFELTVENYRALLYPADIPYLEGAIQDALSTGKDYRLEHRILTKNNSIRWLLGLGVIHFSSNKTPERLIGIVIDITDQKEALRESRDWKKRYELIVESSGQMIYDYNVDKGTILWSGNTSEILGFTNDDMGDISVWSSLIHPDDKEGVLLQLSKAETSLSKFDVVYRFRTANNQYKIVSDRGFFFKDGESLNQVRMLGIMEDITQTKEAEQTLMRKNDELLKINRELDSFVYSASHDLRAPIASLLGLIRVARLEKSLEGIERLLNLQEKSLLKLDSFIRDIVDHSRNSRLELPYEEIDLRKIINESFDQLSFIESIHRIQKTIHISGDVTCISDSKRIQMIVNNLLSNAVKYADLRKPQPFITVEVEVNNATITLKVSDNGEGIPEQQQKKIFDMFYRATENSSGSGLGLYIVYEVVQKLGGTIGIQSTYGVGSTFALTLPNGK